MAINQTENIRTIVATVPEINCGIPEAAHRVSPEQDRRASLAMRSPIDWELNFKKTVALMI